MKNTSREKKNSDDLNKKQQDYSFSRGHVVNRNVFLQEEKRRVLQKRSTQQKKE
jgi:hypothetical protein